MVVEASIEDDHYGRPYWGHASSMMLCARNFLKHPTPTPSLSSFNGGVLHLQSWAITKTHSHLWQYQNSPRYKLLVGGGELIHAFGWWRLGTWGCLVIWKLWNDIQHWSIRLLDTNVFGAFCHQIFPRGIAANMQNVCFKSSVHWWRRLARKCVKI